MTDTRTQAEKTAGKKTLETFIKQQQEERDAQAPNPLQQPPPRHPEPKP
jgi:hypothetical protein